MESKSAEIRKAQERKNYQIKTFQSAKTQEMIRFASWRTAEAMTALTLGKLTEGETIPWWEHFERNLAEAEKRLKKYITGVPF